MRHVPHIESTPAYPANLLAERLSAVGPAIIATLLGFFILYGVGFAAIPALHNAAHDARHALAFPCH